jgi:DNA-binding CsgD family transcriptional regulator
LPQHSTVLTARRNDVTTVADTLRSAGPAQILAVTGAAGAGKTAVLEEGRRVAVGEKATVLRLAWESAEGEPGTPALVDAVCRVLSRIRDGRLPVRITAIRRAQLLTSGRNGDLTVLSVTGRMLADAAHHVPFALVVDDAERIPEPTAQALGLLLRAFRPAGLPVVMAHRTTASRSADGGLLHVADRLLELAPLAADDVQELVEQWFGRPADSEVARAAMHALGPLAGNPQALLSVLEALREDGGLLELDARIHLAARDDTLRLAGTATEVYHTICPGLPTEADGLDSAVALAYLIGAADFRLSDVHDMARWAPHRAAGLARTVDCLVTRRVLTVASSGALSFAVPAFAAALRRSPVPFDVPAIHASIVASAARRLGPAVVGGGHTRLAEHVLAAGPLVRGEDAARILLAAVGKYAAGAAGRAVRAYLAALVRLREDNPDRARLLRAAAELALRDADHAALLALGEPLSATADAQRDSAARRDLAFAARAWGLAALYEHLPPGADGAEPWAVVRRMPGGTELAALGSHYGIGSLTPPSDPVTSAHAPRGGRAAGTVPRPARAVAGGPDAPAGPGMPDAGSAGPSDSCPSDGGATGDGPPGRAGGGVAPDEEEGERTGALPSPARLRLLAEVARGGEVLEAARAGLPPDALDDSALASLRVAAGYGDLAGALAAISGDSHPAAGDSVAGRYHVMVRAYLAGRWDEALSCARRIETYVRASGVSGTSLLARVLAAEVHCLHGEQTRARAWLSQVPDTITHPLGGQVRVGVRYLSGNADEAFAGGWRDVRRARESGLLEGLDRLLLRLFQYGVYEGLPQVADRAVTELEALRARSASPVADEALTLARSVLSRDGDGVVRVLRQVRERADRASVLLCLEVGAMADDGPGPLLSAAVQEAHALGIRHIERTTLGHRARAYGVKLSPPRRRAASERLGDLDRRLVGMVGEGATNRQIAARLACSEKTVEQHLTWLFRLTGCRSRAELAAARLDGRLARFGLPPETSARS